MGSIYGWSTRYFIVYKNIIYSDGGYFKAELEFPDDFPNSPPVMRFKSKMWHPNSILFI